MSLTVNVKQLLEAGVHFGHQTNKWNPKMKPFIFTDRNGVYIINLEKTAKMLRGACDYVRQIAARGGVILLVGTKRQAQEAILAAAQATGMPYVHQRWLGGMLTNFETVRKSVARLEHLEKMEAEGTHQFLTKKEVAMLKTQREKLLKVLAGVREMRKLPDALFVIDPKKEEIAVREARRLGIPVAALIDTNCDPDLIDCAVPGNDDAMRSVKLICEVIASAIREGRDEFGHVRAAEEEQEILEAQESGEEAVTAVVKEAEILDKIEEVVPEKVVEKLVEADPAKPKAKRGRPRKETKDTV